MARVVIDPVTRIEGHLRIEAEMQGGKVSDAWSSGTMFRGIELILRNRDPREAWIWAQRICGVCTTRARHGVGAGGGKCPGGRSSGQCSRDAQHYCVHTEHP